MNNTNNPYTDLFVGVVLLTLAIVVWVQGTQVAINLGPVLPAMAVLAFLYMRIRSVRRF